MTRPIAKSLNGLDASTLYVPSGDGNLRPENGPFGDVPPQRDHRIDRNTKDFFS
jgi:hypothetical protein